MADLTLIPVWSVSRPPWARPESILAAISDGVSGFDHGRERSGLRITTLRQRIRSHARPGAYRAGRDYEYRLASAAQPRVRAVYTNITASNNARRSSSRPRAMRRSRRARDRLGDFRRDQQCGLYRHARRRRRRFMRAGGNDTISLLLNPNRSPTTPSIAAGNTPGAAAQPGAGYCQPHRQHLSDHRPIIMSRSRTPTRRLRDGQCQRRHLLVQRQFRRQPRLHQ